MRYRSEIVVLILSLAFSTGCGEQPSATREAQNAPPPGGGQSQPAAAQEVTLSARQMQMWSASCALCHVNGNADAPIVGIAEHWQPRLEQGMETLLQHTLEGFNSMPPLGYCMACVNEDFTAMIRFMSNNQTSSTGLRELGAQQ